jgi:hypothetical protein
MSLEKIRPRQLIKGVGDINSDNQRPSFIKFLAKKRQVARHRCVSDERSNITLADIGGK